jgi:hypothetical protein
VQCCYRYQIQRPAHRQQTWGRTNFHSFVRRSVLLLLSTKSSFRQRARLQWQRIQTALSTVTTGHSSLRRAGDFDVSDAAGSSDKDVAAAMSDAAHISQWRAHYAVLPSQTEALVAVRVALCDLLTLPPTSADRRLRTCIAQSPPLESAKRIFLKFQFFGPAITASAAAEAKSAQTRPLVAPTVSSLAPVASIASTQRRESNRRAKRRGAAAPARRTGRFRASSD